MAEKADRTSKRHPQPPRWHGSREFVDFMPAVWFRYRYPFRLLGWLLEGHKFLREALVQAWPRAVRRELAVNERVVEIPFVLRALGLPPGSRVLDAGSRWSPLPLHLASLGYQTVATDLKPFPVQGGGLDFVRADLLRPPFRLGSFDGVVMVSTLEHVGIGFYDSSIDPNADFDLMRALQLLLKPKGLLILTVPFGRSAVGPLQRAYDGERLRHVADGWIWEQAEYFVRRGNAWMRTNESSASHEDSAIQTHAVALLVLRRP